MTVLHLTRDFPPRSTGGLSAAVGGLVRATVRAGVPCAVVSFDAWRPSKAAAPAATRDDAGGVPVLRVRSPADLDDARAFARACAPALVHVHDGMLWDFAAGLDAPRAYTPHVLHAELARLRGITETTASLRGQRAALAVADLVLAPAPSVARALGGGDRVRVAPLGVDDPGPPRDRAAGGPVVYAGRFADVNGTAELLEALARLDVDAVVAGGVPENPRADRRWRERFAALPRVALPGWLDAAALDALYRRAAVVVVPSWIETFGLTTLEAAVRGAPVLTCATGGVAELLALPTVPARDADALAAAIERTVRDPEAPRSAAELADRARAALTWDHVIGATLAGYRELAPT